MCNAAPAAGLTEPVAWMVTTRIGSECVDTMAKTKEAAWQIAIERYRNKSGVEHADPVPLYLAPAAGLTVERAYDVWRSFHFRHQKDGEQYTDYLEARNAAYRALLTEAAKHRSNGKED